jgi:hypothetical protein
MGNPQNQHQDKEFEKIKLSCLHNKLQKRFKNLTLIPQSRFPHLRKQLPSL